MTATIFLFAETYSISLDSIKKYVDDENAILEMIKGKINFPNMRAWMGNVKSAWSAIEIAK